MSAHNVLSALYLYTQHSVVITETSFMPLYKNKLKAYAHVLFVFTSFFHNFFLLLLLLLPSSSSFFMLCLRENLFYGLYANHITLCCHLYALDHVRCLAFVYFRAVRTLLFFIVCVPVVLCVFTENISIYS